jgi:serine/threonine protein kinase
MLFECLTGRLPFEADSPVAQLVMHVTKPVPDPRQINPIISKLMTEIVMKLLEKNPNNRYPSAAELYKVFLTAN